MYSQDETIAAVLKLYQQIILHPYFPSSALLCPPPTGWPTITPPNSTKNPAVISLLRHLPYLNFPRATLNWETLAIDYSSPLGTNSSFAEDVYPLLDHCVYLTRSVDREGIALILDTKEGMIAYMGSGCRITVPYEEYDVLPFEEKWKYYPRVPIKEFLDGWTERYEKLVWMLVPNPRGEPTSGRFITRADYPSEEEELLRDHEFKSMDSGGEKDEQKKHVIEVYNTYLSYGWPDQFDKEACRAALLDLEKKSDMEERRKMDEMFPDPLGMFDKD